MDRLKLLLCIIGALFYISLQVPVLGFDSTDVDSDFERLKTQYLPDEFAKANFSLEDAKRLLRQKCKKAGVNKPDVYDTLEQAAVNLVKCANSIANLTEVLEEIEAARPLGELDVVFEKYCERQPRAERCLKDFNTQLLPCLSEAERAQNEIIMHIVSSLLSFICYKNGDQIALFIAEEGPECIEANKDNIANCMNATFSAYMPKKDKTGVSPVPEIPELVLGPKQCIDLFDFEECVLSYLEKCNEITPANIIESMFKYVKNETKCQPEIDKVLIEKQLKKEQKSGGGGEGGGADMRSVWPKVFYLLLVGIVMRLRDFI